GMRGRAPSQIGTPTRGSAFDGPKEFSSNHECPHIHPVMVQRALQVIDGPDLLQSAENREGHFLTLNSGPPQTHGSKQWLHDDVLQPSESPDGLFRPFAYHGLR